MFLFILDKLYMGPGQLYHDLQNLLHDLNVVGQISQLIGSLKGNYQVINKAGFIFKMYSCCKIAQLFFPRTYVRCFLCKEIIFISSNSIAFKCLML